VRLKEPFVKKHVHSWKRMRVDYYSDGWCIERACQECGRQECAFLSKPAYESLPESLVHLADTVWQEGTLKQRYPLAGVNLNIGGFGIWP
jgi:hypothetical protein